MQNELLMFKPEWYDQKDTASGMRQPYFIEIIFEGVFEGEYSLAYQKGDAVVLKWEV